MISEKQPSSPRSIKLALLTNCLSPHTLPLCEALSRNIGELRAFVSAESDEFHGFSRPRASFPITVQRSFNRLRRSYSTPECTIPEQVHIPLDTLPQLMRFGPDVVVSSQFGARTAFAILYCLARPRVRLIVWAALSRHTEAARGDFRSGLRRWMLRHTDAAFVNGRSGEEYLRLLGFKGEVCNVPYTIDPEPFERFSYAPRDGELRLLFCGRIEKSKGIAEFCQLLHQWCQDHLDRKIHFTIVGNGPDQRIIQQLVPLTNLSITMLPHMDSNELIAQYGQADLFVFPSLFDEWGVVVNEALNAGLPVLGSKYSQAVLELVRDGSNGWQFDPQDRAQTYSQLDLALRSSASELKVMSSAAREATAAISPGIVAKRAAMLIRGCVLRPRGQQPRSSVVQGEGETQVVASSDNAQLCSGIALRSRASLPTITPKPS